MGSDDTSSTPTESSRPRSKSDRRRIEIVQQAAQLMNERGYHRTSMDDIAVEVGLRKPSLYYYFKNKQELLYWLHDEFVGTLIRRYRPRLAIQMSPENRLFEAVVDLLGMTETHRGHVRVYFENLRELSPELLVKVLAMRDEYQGLLQEDIVRAIEGGTFRDVDPFLTSRSLFGTCIWSYFWYESDRHGSSRDIAYVFWAQFLNGVRLQDAGRA